MFVIRRHSDGKFLKRKSTYVESVQNARIFNRIEDSKQASAYVGFYSKNFTEYIKYSDSNRPVYIEKVFVIPESLLI
jgi:hypothetical protein